MTLRSSISGFARSMLRNTGREVVPYDIQHFPDQHRRKLMENAGITLVLDVGGNLGQTGQELREAGYSRRIVSFEPQSTPFEHLSQLATADGNWSAQRCAVGEEDGSIEMNVSGTHWSSSILPMTDRHRSMVPESAYVGKETVPLCRLDSLFERHVKSDDRVYLKVDTQGYELGVLRGSGSRLSGITLVQLELSLVDLYAGQPRYYDLMKFMDENGFDMVSINCGFMEQGTAHYLQADAIFANRALRGAESGI